VLTFGGSATAPIPAELPRLVDNPSVLDISDGISNILPLNNKQKRTVSMIFHHALRLQGKLAVEEEDQFFLHMGGPGGTGKSRIIDAARLGMKLLGRDIIILIVITQSRRLVRFLGLLNIIPSYHWWSRPRHTTYHNVFVPPVSGACAACTRVPVKKWRANCRRLRESGDSGKITLV
jgi:hypothetical protein